MTRYGRANLAEYVAGLQVDPVGAEPDHGERATFSGDEERELQR